MKIKVKINIFSQGFAFTVLKSALLFCFSCTDCSLTFFSSLAFLIILCMTRWWRNSLLSCGQYKWNFDLYMQTVCDFQRQQATWTPIGEELKLFWCEDKAQKLPIEFLLIYCVIAVKAPQGNRKLSTGQSQRGIIHICSCYIVSKSHLYTSYVLILMKAILSK